jgi:hypothetical protein
MGPWEKVFYVKRLIGDLSVGFQATDQEGPTIVYDVRSRSFMTYPTHFIVSSWFFCYVTSA